MDFESLKYDIFIVGPSSSFPKMPKSRITAFLDRYIGSKSPYVSPVTRFTQFTYKYSGADDQEISRFSLDRPDSHAHIY